MLMKMMLISFCGIFSLGIHAHTYHEREGVAATWSVLVFHACEQADQGKDVDLSESVIRNVSGVIEVHHPAPREFIDSYLPLKILHATSGTKDWFGGYARQKHPSGLVTFNREQKRIVVAFRGTQKSSEKYNNFNPGVKKSQFLDFHLHAGYVNLFETVAEDVRESVQVIVDANSDLVDLEILVTGHSLGGAMATLTAAYLAKHYHNKLKVHLVAFGAPHVGYENFNTWALSVLASAVSFERETDIAPHGVARIIGTRWSWEVGGWPEFASDVLSTRRPVGEIVKLPSYGHYIWMYPLSHSVRHYRHAVYAALNWPFEPLFDIKMPYHLSWLNELVNRF